ncbi:Oxidation resistance protein 1 [Escovopsis weberi]|uniref:Oxidation resistance protein 1 n=1 Tax=Escovopsis weberi TaxID=150374 RepID=A0A0M8N0N5_ESCWE|nr:Oxidation resistance protein 1 [Escovopsis weberi]
MWTGLIRRFSSEGETLDPYARGPSEHAIPGPLRAADADAAAAAFARPRGRIPSPFIPPPLDPVVLHGYKDSTPRSSRLLTPLVAEEIRTMVPERLRITEDWSLIYSLEQNGASLATLYQKCRHYAGMRVGFVLVVCDHEGATFGAYLSDYPHPAPSYFGNGECFLWRASPLTPLPSPHPLRHAAPPGPTDRRGADTDTDTDTDINADADAEADTDEDEDAHAHEDPAAASMGIRFKAFPYSGLNDYYINCETGFLSVGSGGGHYGLWLDDSLDVGHSSTCETFGNEPLSDAGHKFRVIGLELWVLGAS